VPCARGLIYSPMLCVGCQAEFSDLDGPTHEYMLSVPACWAVYGELLAREYGDYRLANLNRLTVDAYAAQHPGVNVPAARRSVGVHLSRLYLYLEAGWSMERVNNAMPAILEFKDTCDWLEPPSMVGTLSVLDVSRADSTEAHETCVRSWAESVWKAWTPHHHTVRKWCATLP
jgi:hypothetical protein